MDNSPISIQKQNVDGEAHPDAMNGLRRHDEQACGRGETTLAEQTHHPAHA